MTTDTRAMARTRCHTGHLFRDFPGRGVRQILDLGRISKTPGF